MSTTQLVLIPAFFVFLVTVARYAGWATSWVAAYLISLGGITTVLYTLPGDMRTHYGIAQAHPTLWLSDVLLVGAVIAIWNQKGRLGVGWPMAAFSVPTLVLLLFVWGNTPEQWSGFKLYLTALVSFGIGRWLSENLTDRGALVIVCACLTSCTIQFIITFAQSRGFLLVPLPGQDARQWIDEGRMVGLYNHPGYLGRTMFLLLCFLIPLAASTRAATRKLAQLSIVLGFLATLLTLSRANSVAVSLALSIWFLLSGQAQSFTKRLSILAFGAVVLALNSSSFTALEARQELDPQGGYRSSILEVGLRQISDNPLVGTGPNYYSEIVSQYDRFAATGFPLHNSFLYPIAELGVPLAALFFYPIAATVIGAVAWSISARRIDARAIALFAILPGIIVSAMTGFGLVATEALPLFYMGFGFLARMSTGDSSDERRHIVRQDRMATPNARYVA